MAVEYPDGFCAACGKWAAPPKVVLADSADPNLATVESVFCDLDYFDEHSRRLRARWPLPAGR
jgi:hypothetical protein